LKASEKRPGKVVDYHAGLTALGLADTQAAAMRASELVAFFLTLGAEGYVQSLQQFLNSASNKPWAAEIKSRSARSVLAR